MDHGPTITMIHFSHLQNIKLPELCRVFNLAFSDYIVPFQLTVPLLEQKLQGENVRLSHCIGAFDGPTLAGFILHGADTWPKPALLYNGGTGVIPAYRGQHLVQRMYAHYRQQYKQEGKKRIGSSPKKQIRNENKLQCVHDPDNNYLCNGIQARPHATKNPNRHYDF